MHHNGGAITRDMHHTVRYMSGEIHIATVSNTEVGLTIVVPAYNEEQRIEKTVEAYVRYFVSSFLGEFRILVVLNGCTDNTEEVVQKCSRAHSQVQYVNFQQKLGKGGAVIEGLKRATGRLICFVDADNMVEPQETAKLVRALEHYDVAIGSRWMSKDPLRVDRPWIRKVVSWLVRLVARLLLRLDYVDTQCGSKAFRSDALKIVLDDLSERGWAFDLDLLVCSEKKGLRVNEIPVVWKHVDEGSKVNFFADFPQELRSLIRIWRKRYSDI